MVCQNIRQTRRSYSIVFCLALFSLSTLSGCAAFRPLKGVPARYLPEELKGCSREDGQMIDLSYLRQQAPAEYMVDAGDVLAIYIENVLGQRDQPPINQPLDTTRPPTLGYPLTVRDDGTLSLPLTQPIDVRGKTIPQIERDIRYAYTIQRRLLQPGRDRILVTLHRPRQHRILVIRQETQSDVLSGVSVSGGSLGTAKKGTGHVVSLPAYRNDVLNALVQSGGLPGLDAQNVVYVMRARRSQRVASRPQPSPQPAPVQPGFQPQPGNYAPQIGQPPYQNTVPSYHGPAQNGLVPQQGLAPSGQIPPSGYGPTSSYPPVNNAEATSPANDGSLIIRAQSPATAQTPPPRGRYSGIQPIDYWKMATPSQVADNLTGTPASPTQPSLRGRITQTYHQVMNGNTSGAEPAFSGGTPQVGNPTYQPSPYSVNAPPVNAPQAAPSLAPQWQSPPPQQQFASPPMQQQFSPPPQPSWQPPGNWANAQKIAQGNYCNQQNSIRIPLRLEDYEAVNFTESDIILEDGDIVFIASRDNELFYTGGLLGGGEYTLPRDRDLDILEAIAIAESNNNQGADAGSSALNSDVSISPSEAIILRKLPNDTQVSILVDLYRARTHASERINIQPGDYIIVQYTKLEAVGAFIERHILESALFGVAGAQLSTGGR